MSYTKFYLDLINDGYSEEESSRIVQSYREEHDEPKDETNDN